MIGFISTLERRENMRTFSKRFLKVWASYHRFYNKKKMPNWMFVAVQHDADKRCNDSIKKIVND
jgi:hypothetical protein